MFVAYGVVFFGSSELGLLVCCYCSSVSGLCNVSASVRLCNDNVVSADLVIYLFFWSVACVRTVVGTLVSLPSVFSVEVMGYETGVEGVSTGLVIAASSGGVFGADEVAATASVGASRGSSMGVAGIVLSKTNFGRFFSLFSKMELKYMACVL